MEEEYDQFLEWIKSILPQAIHYFEVWLGRLQTDEHLQDVMLGFLVGSAFGWFLSSLLSKKRNSMPGIKNSSGSVIRTTEGRTKEEVELDARRRL
jgi:hypothetical protein